MGYQKTVPLRDPSTVMRLSRLGSLHQCRLSFMRTLTRRMAREKWSFSRPVFDIDDKGVGHAVYTAKAKDHAYSLVAFAHDLPDELRSDRVIAEAWDATFTLFDGVPTKEDIARLSKNVPYQEAGRVSESELSLSRANRSVRLWAHVVDALSKGCQPDAETIDNVGYLMRTTAVYGSGKFGAADRDVIAGRPEMHAPFQAEMLSVYLTRTFVRDLVQHMADVAGGDRAVPLDADIARKLGIGNSTGLGMAPYIINHPVIFNNWIQAREEAIARVRAVENAKVGEKEVFLQLLRRSEASVSNWHSEHPIQIRKLNDLKHDLKAIFECLADFDLIDDQPWDRLMGWAESSLTEEGQELIASLILEPYPHLVDELSDSMSDSNSDAFLINGAMPIGEIRSLIEASFEWALPIDWEKPENCSRVWYVSEEKLEPRLGERFEEDLDCFEQPLAPARDMTAAYKALGDYDDNSSVAEFLIDHPEHRHTLRRIQIRSFAPYSEIMDNTISDKVLPIDMLRSKLSFFGAIHFDPRSDRWVRICMYAGAPYPEELTDGNSDHWVYPVLPS